MKVSSFRYLIKEGFRNLWQNRFMGITSIGVLVSCLILCGGAYLIFANVEHVFDWASEQNIIVAWTAEGATEEEIVAVEAKIKSLGNVKGVERLTKDKILEKYESTLPNSINNRFQEGDNPFVDGFVVNFKDLSQFNSTVELIKKIEGVDDFSSQSNLTATLIKARNLVFIIGGGIVGLLLLVSLFIISNTIKLTVYNRRLEISIMKSVGATNAFIRLPFVIEGMLLGAFSAGVGYGLTFAIYSALVKNVSLGFMGSLLGFSQVSLYLLVGFLVIGIVTGIMGSVISISKYLKTEGGLAGVI